MQPKIASIPDSIGEFISERYPALLADPIKEPEIYNSAVTDYGVYASPELYGSDRDYLVYADVDDYTFVPSDENQNVSVQQKIIKQPQQSDDYLVIPDYVAPKENAQESPDVDFIIVARGDTLYSIAKKNNTTVSELAKINSLKEPYTLSIGQKLYVRASSQQKEIKKIEPAKVVAPVIEKNIAQEEIVKNKSAKSDSVKPTNTKRVAIQEITVVPGDTLYSLSRKYEIPVNDLAVMNKISSPFILSVGQKLKVPKIDNVDTRVSNKPKSTEPTKNNKIIKTDSKSADVLVKNNTKTKISSDPKKQLPKITARSSAKFSWPIRGKILSQYGAKNGGLFNDGINIAGKLGMVVKAAENGVVAYAGNEVKGMGNLVIIQHSDGWMTVYAHLDSMSVRRGTKVSVGQQIGKIGKTGKVDSPQLHFEIRKGTKAYNPTQYLKK